MKTHFSCHSRWVVFLVLLTLSSLAQAQSYKYDKAGRLISVTYPDGKQIHYAYDKAGNLVYAGEAKKKKLRKLTKQANKK